MPLATARFRKAASYSLVKNGRLCYKTHLQFFPCSMIRSISASAYASVAGASNSLITFLSLKTKLSNSDNFSDHISAEVLKPVKSPSYSASPPLYFSISYLVCQAFSILETSAFLRKDTMDNKTMLSFLLFCGNWAILLSASALPLALLFFFPFSSLPSSKVSILS